MQIRTYLCVLLSLVAANFFGQIFLTQNWLVAADRSFFQAISLIIIYVVESRLKRANKVN
jgi:hypothetical protein